MVPGLFEGCDAVVHLAALPKPWESYENVHANNMMTDYLMYTEAARAKVSLDYLMYTQARRPRSP